MVNYSNGKIYKIEPICDHDEGEIYIGSTTKQYLSQRMDKHRSNYKQWKNNKYRKVQVFEIFDKYGVSNCQIVLIETVNAESKDELLAREKHYIKSSKCLNKINPLRTIEEKRIQRNEIVKAFHLKHPDKIKEYREANKEKNKKKTACPCGGLYSHSHKLQHFITIKHQEYLKSQIIDV